MIKILVSTLLGNTCAQACSCACCSCFIYTYTVFVLSSDDTRSQISFTTQGILIVLLFCRSYILICSIIIENFLITNVGILYTFMSCVSTIRC
uniref:Secreted protein n=1 Tax=Rhipicephalus microplus TaxID=6941 RepID=A0A6M2DBC9_RHIMP